MIRYSWQRLDDGRSWGVKASGLRADEQQGQTVRVAKRDGGSSDVTLGPRVTRWNGGSAAVYKVGR